MNQNEIIKTKIHIIKEELSKWKTELLNMLSINIFKSEELFLITGYWLANYEKYISDIKNINPEFDIEYADINNELLGLFSQEDISNEKLPKVFVLNKNIWNLIQTENYKVYPMMSIGIFFDNLLLLKVSEKIHCFFFIDNKNQLRQGYLEITNMFKEYLILNDIQINGIFKMIENNQINDDKLLIINTDYEIIITEIFDNNKKMKELIKKKMN